MEDEGVGMGSFWRDRAVIEFDQAREVILGGFCKSNHTICINDCTSCCYPPLYRASKGKKRREDWRLHVPPQPLITRHETTVCCNQAVVSSWSRDCRCGVTTVYGVWCGARREMLHGRQATDTGWICA